MIELRVSPLLKAESGFAWVMLLAERSLEIHEGRRSGYCVRSLVATASAYVRQRISAPLFVELNIVFSLV